MHGTTVKIIRI